jgi:hypothetical protein
MRITSALLLSLLAMTANGFGIHPSQTRRALVRGGASRWVGSMMVDGGLRLSRCTRVGYSSDLCTLLYHTLWLTHLIFPRTTIDRSTRYYSLGMSTTEKKEAPPVSIGWNSHEAVVRSKHHIPWPHVNNSFWSRRLTSKPTTGLYSRFSCSRRRWPWR